MTDGLHDESLGISSYHSDFKVRDLGQVWTENPGQVPVHAGRISGGPFQLLFTLCPETMYRPLLGFEVVPERHERLDDAFDALAEFRTGKIVVQELDLVLAALEGTPGASGFDQSLAQRRRESNEAMTTRHPHALDVAEVGESLWEFFAREDREIRPRRPLVVTKFR